MTNFWKAIVCFAMATAIGLPDPDASDARMLWGLALWLGWMTAHAWFLALSIWHDVIKAKP